jgi:hypothetical protein
MAERSDFEEFIDTAFRHPLFGVICSAVLAGLGFYLTAGGLQLNPGNARVVVLPTAETLGRFCFVAAGLVMIISAGGYLWRLVKK